MMEKEDKGNRRLQDRKNQYKDRVVQGDCCTKMRFKMTYSRTTTHKSPICREMTSTNDKDNQESRYLIYSLVIKPLKWFLFIGLAIVLALIVAQLGCGGNPVFSGDFKVSHRHWQLA